MMDDNFQIRPQVPPEKYKNRKGRSPELLTDNKVKLLISTPDTWYLIGTSADWISGVKHNIESMTQRNLVGLKDKGGFEIQQRRNEQGTIDIYCQWIPTKERNNNGYE